MEPPLEVEHGPHMNGHGFHGLPSRILPGPSPAQLKGCGQSHPGGDVASEGIMAEVCR